MSAARSTGRQHGEKAAATGDSTLLPSRNRTTSARPEHVDVDSSGRVVMWRDLGDDVLYLNDSDAAFLELTEEVLKKAQAVQKDPKRRRPRLRFR